VSGVAIPAIAGNMPFGLKGKLGEKPPYGGRILAVGITFDKKNKKHSCKAEILKSMTQTSSNL